MRSPLIDYRVRGRPRWTLIAAGGALGAGIHTLAIVVIGLAPQAGDDPAQWSFYFLYASAVPVFLVLVVGLILAPLGSRLGPLGIGMVVGAIVSPTVWMLAGSAVTHGQ